MRSPDTSRNDLASSNSTANAFLGGRPPPAWMAACPPRAPTAATATAPTRKRRAPTEPAQPRRASKHSSSSPSPLLPCAPPAAAPASCASQHASNPASPALPNVVAPGATASATGSANNVLPSPAPSEDISAERSERAGRREARETVILNLDEDETDTEPESESRQEGSNPTNAPASVGPRSSIDRQASHDTSTPSSARPTGTPNAVNSVQASSSRLSSPQGLVTPSLLTPCPPRARALPPPGQSCYAQEFCLSELQHLIAHYTGGRALHDVEKIRVHLLRDAIVTGDRDYLGLHQLMCLRTLRPAHLPQETSAFGGAAFAFDLLDHLLVQGSGIRQAILLWFSTFPVDLRLMKQEWPQEYSRQVQAFKEFGLRASSGWRRVEVGCQRKGLPPTVPEIRRELGIGSHLLEHVVNRAMLRRIRHPIDHLSEPQAQYLNEAEGLFREHQRRMRNIRSVAGGQIPAEESTEDDRYNRAMSNLNARFRHAFAAQTPTLPERQQALPERRPPSSPEGHSTAPQRQLNATYNSPYAASGPASGLPSQAVASQPSLNYINFQQNQHLAPITMAQAGAFVPVPHVQNQQIQNQQIQNQQLQSQQIHIQQLQNHQRNLQFQNWQRTQQLHSPTTPPGYPPLAWQGPSNPAYQQRPAASQNVEAHQTLRTNSLPSNTLVHVQAQRPAPQRPMNPGRPTNQPRPQSSPLVPPNGHMWQPQAIDPSGSALHQAHLRSPVLKTASNAKLYQSVAGFAVSPAKLADNAAQQFFEFKYSAAEQNILPKDEHSPCKPATRLVSESSKMYRLRCARPKTTLDEHNWVLEDTVWPSGVFLIFNGKHLEARKRLQHGKDLPIDITPYVQHGKNQLEVSILRHPKEEPISNFAISIEIVGIQRHEMIIAECLTKRRIPADDVLDSIKSGLSGAGDDDDIAIVDSNISINLFDPFTSCRIFAIPVRGSKCLHRDCFDLETFLHTRSRRRKDAPSVVDMWKCPICKADARPSSLVVDGFLVNVRDKLARAGQLDTRAIVVESDGGWRRKPKDKKQDNDDDSTPEGNNTPAAPTPARLHNQRSTSVQDVIELDSD